MFHWGTMKGMIETWHAERQTDCTGIDSHLINIWLNPQSPVMVINFTVSQIDLTRVTNDWIQVYLHKLNVLASAV